MVTARTDENHRKFPCSLLKNLRTVVNIERGFAWYYLINSFGRMTLMLENRPRFALLGLAFVLTLPVYACDSAESKKPSVIDVESKPKIPVSNTATAPVGPTAN